MNANNRQQTPATLYIKTSKAKSFSREITLVSATNTLIPTGVGVPLTHYTSKELQAIPLSKIKWTSLIYYNTSGILLKTQRAKLAKLGITTLYDLIAHVVNVPKGEMEEFVTLLNARCYGEKTMIHQVCNYIRETYPISFAADWTPKTVVTISTAHVYVDGMDPSVLRDIPNSVVQEAIHVIVATHLVEAIKEVALAAKRENIMKLKAKLDAERASLNKLLS